MDGKAIFDFSINEVPKQIKDITQNIKVKLKDINYFIFHQANKFLVDTIVDKLNISSKKTLFSLKNLETRTQLLSQ